MKMKKSLKDASLASLGLVLTTFSFFSLSSSLLPPRLSFLLVSPSSSSLLPPGPSFFLIQHCPNHLASVKVHFSSILTKALPTNGPTNRPTDKTSYRDADASKNPQRPQLACLYVYASHLMWTLGKNLKQF